MMVDPIFNSCGITYDRIAYQDRLLERGNYDPQTNKAVDRNFMMDNVTLKKQIQNFI